MESNAKLHWYHNEWDGDCRWNDREHAMIEALREIAQQLSDLNHHNDKKAETPAGQAQLIELVPDSV